MIDDLIENALLNTAPEVNADGVFDVVRARAMARHTRRRRRRAACITAGVVVMLLIASAVLVQSRGDSRLSTLSGPSDRATAPTNDDGKVENPEVDAPGSGDEPARSTIDGLLAPHVSRETDFNAEQRLIQQCMARLGFVYVTSVFVDTMAATRTLGVNDANAAATYGYHPTPDETRAASGSGALAGIEAVPAGERAAYVAALTGSEGSRTTLGDGTSFPGGGCVAQAWNQLSDGRYAALATLSVQVQNLKNEATAAARSDATFNAALNAWRNCMADAGYSVDHPSNIGGRFIKSESDLARAPSPDEIRTATQDVTCKDKTLLLSIWQTAKSDAERTIVDRERTVLTQWAALRATYSTNALAALDK